MIFTQLIKANLSTQVLGRDIEYYVRAESTNTEAAELLEEGAAEGTVVVTDTQTAGRGRHNRTWFSAPGKGLTFSVILKPDLPGPDAGTVSLMSAVAAAEAMEQFKLAPELKWPNDLLLSDRKCGGILVESRFQGSTMLSAIVGVGINVNESDQEFPREIRDGSVSILMVNESPAQRELLLAWTLNSLEQWYDRLKSGDHNAIISAWKDRCSHLEKPVHFMRDGETHSGIFADVSEDGKAVIRQDDDEMILSAEEIQLLHQA